MNTSSTPQRPIAVVAAVIRDHAGRFMLAERPKGDAHGGHWEFPGGKIDHGETPEAALVREIEEELGWTVAVDELFSVESEVYAPDRHIILIAYHCRILAIDPDFPGERPRLYWFRADDDLDHLPVLPPDRRNLQRLKKRFA